MTQRDLPDDAALDALVASLESWWPLVSSGYEVPAAGIVMFNAAAAITDLRARVAELQAQVPAQALDAMALADAEEIAGASLQSGVITTEGKPLTFRVGGKPIDPIAHAARVLLAAFDEDRRGRWQFPREGLDAAIDVHGIRLTDISALGFRCSPQAMLAESFRATLRALAGKDQT